MDTKINVDLMEFIQTIKNIKTNNKKMCKTDMKSDFHIVKIYKNEHGKNMTRLWCKIMTKIDVEGIERNEKSYLYQGI